MSNFFGLTQEDMSDGKAVFADGDKATLQITSVVKKEINNRPKMIFECVILDGKNVGLKHSLWFSTDIGGGRKALGIFLTSLVPPAQLQQMQDPSALINQKFSCDFIQKGDFLSERNVRPVSDVPAGLGAAPVLQPAVQQQPVYTTQPVPTPAAAVQQPVQQTPTVINKNIF